MGTQVIITKHGILQYMNNKIQFSVLMSVYGKDNADFFNQALLSVTEKQTLKPEQVVIVQDGPVSSLIDDYISKAKIKEPTIEFSVLKKEINRGLAAALNDGILFCKYDWIARMDSDDISLPDRFEKQVDFICNNRTIDVVGGCIDEFIDCPEISSSIRNVPSSHSKIAEMAKTRTPMNHVSVFYSKKAVERAGLYSVDFGKLEDYRLWIDMLASGARFANLPDVLVHVRIGNGFIERRSNKREIEDWDMLQCYLLKIGWISKPKALMNKFCIRAFINMPIWMKKGAYRTVLRKHK